ncbi:hypothetical protein KFE25_011539 [Diacronema lutheri]|uniref:Uncharacterized protein n=1 Tax=Diacronema lutheri TaxID=2081491 RepID=A0A8J5XCZ3_DIALT|nr:hypothetical protein KFE25_011539 [Diacronema lutheri]
MFAARVGINLASQARKTRKLPKVHLSTLAAEKPPLSFGPADGGEAAGVEAEQFVALGGAGEEDISLVPLAELSGC